LIPASNSFVPTFGKQGKLQRKYHLKYDSLETVVHSLKEQLKCLGMQEFMVLSFNPWSMFAQGCATSPHPSSDIRNWKKC